MVRPNRNAALGNGVGGPANVVLPLHCERNQDTPSVLVSRFAHERWPQLREGEH
jgi:hypothetical protein